MSKHEKTTLGEYAERVKIPVISGIIGAVCATLSIGIMTYTASQAFQKIKKEAIELGIQQGRAEATSNLVSAVETMTRFSKDNLNYRALGAFDNPGLNDQQKMSYGEACFHGIRYLDRISELIQTDATKIASGEKTAEESLKSFIEFESTLNNRGLKY